jgi:class 3 adenylate cyclase/pimeloyl-ACP methyl ester carboxylesterase
MDLPPTRYTDTTDGLSIAYQTLGVGPPNLLYVMGFASHVELFWELPGYAYTYGRCAQFSRLGLFDKRGTGLSDRHMGTRALEDRMKDVQAVMDAAEFSSAFVLGASEGAAMAAMYAATFPQRVDGLIILGGDVTGEWVDPGIFDAIERDWGTGVLMSRFWLNGAGDIRQLGRIERAMGTPRAMADQMRHNLDLDARPVLETIRVPTLILHCTGDPVVPIRAGRRLAAEIPGARLVEIPGRFHGSNLPGEMARYVDEIEEFVTGQRGATAASAGDRVLATTLITDIVGSTERAVRSGDRRWAAELAEHDRVSRDAVTRFDGRWLKSTGDGALAIFDGPARAVAAARAIARTLSPMGLQIRAGVHTGEVELSDHDVHGVAVHIAARIAALAAGGEIWVSPTVPGLVVGSGLTFADRGSFELKGVPGRWQLAAVCDP